MVTAMFGFLKDMMQELRGIDVEATKAMKSEQLTQQIEAEKRERYILGKTVRRIMMAASALYIIISIGIIITLITFGAETLEIIFQSTLMMLSITIFTAVVIRRKKGEIVAIICSGAFLLLMFILL